MLSRFSAFGFGFITAGGIAFGLLSLSRLDGNGSRFDHLEAAFRSGELNTEDEFDGFPAKSNATWSVRRDDGVQYTVFRFARRGEIRELWMYLRSEGDSHRLFGAQVMDMDKRRSILQLQWLALDPEAMAEFMTFQASRLER